MTSVITGKLAEQAVAEFLIQRGFDILYKNWRTRRCEIDIVAYHRKRVYFIEVKYRDSDKYGDGFAYITSTKLRQMKYAAEIWVANNNWYGEFQLSGASVIGSSYDVTFIEEL